MKKNELLKILKKRKVPSISYSLDGIKSGECLCLVNEGDKWNVVYNSRGEIIHVDDFHSEEDACEFMYDEIKRQYKW